MPIICEKGDNIRRTLFGWVAYSRISEEDKILILGANMNKILESTHLPSLA